MTDHAQLAGRILELVDEGVEAQVSVMSGKLALTRFANSFVHQNVAESQRLVILKVADDGRVASASTTKLDDASLQAFVAHTLDTARLQPPDHDWPGLAPPADVPEVDHFDEATAAAGPAERAAVVKAFVDAGNGMRAAGYCETDEGDIYFANTAGQRAGGRYTRATVDGIHQTETSAGSGHQTSDRLADLDGGAVGALAADRARRAADAYDVKPGEYEVVLSPECAATIAVFLAGYGFQGKAFNEGQSFVELGAPQFDPSFQFWDDASAEGALGVTFDFDGTPKRRVDFVKDGVATALAHDRRSARIAGAESTGHAVPGSESWGPFPQDMFIGGGTTSVDDMIASIERGLYVSTFNYCRVLDPKTLVVTGLTRNGTFMIENGRITGAVTNLRFTESFVDALGPGRILHLGDDSRFGDSEFGPGVVHAPSLHLAGWKFTGGAEG